MIGYNWYKVLGEDPKVYIEAAVRKIGHVDVPNGVESWLWRYHRRRRRM